MKIIDLHAHLASYEMLAEMTATGTDRPPTFESTHEGVFLRLGGRGGIGPVPPGIHDLDVRLKDMDRQGVDIQVLAVAPILYFYDQPEATVTALARVANTHLIEVAARHPDRFFVAGTLPMQHPAGAIRELEWLRTQPAVRMLQIGSHIDGTNLDAPELEPVWAAIAQADVPVLIHPAHVAGADRMKRFHIVNLVGNPNDSTIAIASLLLGGVLEIHPMRIMFVHGGGFAPYQVGRWDHAWNTRADVRTASTQPPSATMASCYFDALTHDDESLRFLGQRVGWDHVVLGSDYPFDMAEDEPVNAVQRLGLDLRDEEAVLGANALEFLRLNDESPVGDGVAR